MILVALGSNLPGAHASPAALLRAALDDLEKAGKLRILAASRLWLTAPVPISDQPWYHNAVIRIETEQGPQELLEILLETERRFGRTRDVPNAARTLDLDLIDHEGRILDTPALTLPHPRMHLRAFVLRPLAEIAPEWVHPVTGRALCDLVDSLPEDQETQPLAKAALR